MSIERLYTLFGVFFAATAFISLALGRPTDLLMAAVGLVTVVGVKMGDRVWGGRA